MDGFKNFHYSAEACGEMIALLKSASTLPVYNTSSESESGSDASSELHFVPNIKNYHRRAELKNSDEITLNLKKLPERLWKIWRVFPGLYRRLCQDASIVATSAAFDRLFFKVGATISTMLSPCRLEELLFPSGTASRR